MNPEQIINLRLTKETNRIRVEIHDSADDDVGAVRRHELQAINEDEVSDLCASASSLLEKANERSGGDQAVLKELKSLGQRLYNLLLTASAKEKLQSFPNNEARILANSATFRRKELQSLPPTQHIILSIDDSLAQIPWELLYDGEDFLCQRFSVGRIVTTQGDVKGVSRELSQPFNMARSDTQP